MARSTLAILAILGLLFLVSVHGYLRDDNDYDYDNNDDNDYDYDDDYDYNDDYSKKGKNKDCKNKHDDKDDDCDYDYDYDYNNDDDYSSYNKHDKCKNKHDKDDDKCKKKHDKDDDKCYKKHDKDDKCNKKHKDKCPSKKCPTTDLAYKADQLITLFLTIFNEAVNESDITVISSKHGPRLQALASRDILIIVNNRYNSQYNYDTLGDYLGDAGKVIDVSMRLVANRAYNVSKDCKKITVKGLYHGAEHNRINTAASCPGFWTIVAGMKEFTLVFVKGEWKIQLVRIREVAVFEANPKTF